MPNIIQIFKKNINILIKILPLISFIVPFLILYSLYPESFETTWKGRTFYIFFLWLVCLEMILNWEKFEINRITKVRSVRTVGFVIALTLPTIYVLVANYWGLNAIILDLAEKNNVYWANWMPLSTEYLVFTVLFGLIILLAYKINGLINFSVSMFFLGTIGAIYMIDTYYPWGRFTPFQMFVPTTATLAANILNLMGYKTSISFISNHPEYGTLPYLEVSDAQGKTTGFGIGWPCSGVESLLIYTVTILLFLKKTDIPWVHKIIYFVIGAIVTYFINALRIATIFVIALGTGGGYTPQAQRFHDYYGQLYSITWIMAYLLIIIGSRALWGKIKDWRTGAETAAA